MQGAHTVEFRHRPPTGFGRGVPVTRRSLAAGFTYIGVLVLVAIMGLAAALVSELWQIAQQREKEQELLFVGNQFRRALGMYSANGGAPLRLEDLLKDSRVPGVRRYLRKIYRDPITGGTDWGLVKSGGTEGVITGVYSLSAAEPLKKSEFDLADKEFEGKKKYSEWVFAAKPTQGAQAAATPAAAGTGAPAGSGAASAAGAGADAPAVPAASSQANAGASQTEIDRPQARVRR